MIIMTNALFNNPGCTERVWLEALPGSVKRILIADEVHHLGAGNVHQEPAGVLRVQDRFVRDSHPPIRS